MRLIETLSGAMLIPYRISRVPVAGGGADSRWYLNHIYILPPDTLEVLGMDLTNDVVMTIALLIAWLCMLLSADEVMLGVVIPFMIGSCDWINGFLK